jgi:hypothetical protein
MCLVACCLAVKFLPLSRELFVIRCPKTQTANFRVIIVQRNLCFKVSWAHGLIIHLGLLFQASHFRPQFPQNPRIPTSWIISFSLSTATKLSFCPSYPIMSALPLYSPLNLNLGQSRRLWTQAPSIGSRGNPASGIKTEGSFHLCVCAGLPDLSQRHTHTPFCRNKFCLSANFQACVLLVIVAAPWYF